MSTQTEYPLDQPCSAWAKINGRWHRVTLTASITEGGTIKNRLTDENGVERVMRNDSLRFQKQRPRD